MGEVREYIEQHDFVVLAEKQLELGGLPALWIDTEAGETDTPPKYPAIQVFVWVDNRVVLLSAYGELSPVTDIVNSIRPIQDTIIGSQ